MDEHIQEPAIAYPHHISLQEYLNMEWENGQRYEYWEGELMAMAGSSIRHAEITGNINAGLRPAIKKSECKIFQSDVFLKSLDGEKYFLPDILVTCHKEDFVAERFIKHPSIIVEVLSDSTELYDRTKKWTQYRQIKSLRYFLLVSQKEYLVEMYHRANESSLFSFQSFSELEQIIPFSLLGFELSMQKIFDRIELPVL